MSGAAIEDRFFSDYAPPSYIRNSQDSAIENDSSGDQDWVSFFDHSLLAQKENIFEIESDAIINKSDIRFPKPITLNLTSGDSFRMSTVDLTIENSRICGLPGFCRESAYKKCFNVALSNCDECSKSGSIFFILFVMCLGLAILIGNLIILAVGWKRQKSGKANKMDVCRCSLAIADLLTGDLSASLILNS